MLRAEKEGVTPEQLIERMHGEHLRDFTDFGVAFDNYHSTHSRGKPRSRRVHLPPAEAGRLIATREIEQFYDPVKDMFLAGPLHQGRVPEVRREGPVRRQLRGLRRGLFADRAEEPVLRGLRRGPGAQALGALLLPPLRPRSADFPARVGAGTNADGSRRMPPEVANKVTEWLGASGEDKLADWDISRDAPYFGFEIPGAPGQVLLRLARRPDRLLRELQGLCGQERRDRLRGLHRGRRQRDGGHGNVPLHRQGHPLLPRAVLAGDAPVLRASHADQLYVNGFLTVNGEKMSKSRGTFITARSLPRAGPESRVAALLLRRQAERRRWRTSTSTWTTSSRG